MPPEKITLTRAEYDRLVANIAWLKADQGRLRARIDIVTAERNQARGERNALRRRLEELGETVPRT